VQHGTGRGGAAAGGAVIGCRWVAGVLQCVAV